MKFLHTADWHIGGCRNFIPDYLQRQERMVDDVFSAAKKNDCKTVVVAGDIFDSADTTHEERDLLLRKLIKYDARGYHILIIPGNHDSVNNSITTLHYLAVLCDAGKFKQTHIVERTTVVNVDNVMFLLLVSSGRKFKENLTTALDEINTSSIRLNNQPKLVVVTHQTLRGSVTVSGHRLKDGVNLMDSKEIIYYALGDIHLKQRVANNAFYPGSPLQTEFNRTDHNNGVLIVDTNKPKKPQFVEIKSKRLIVLKPKEIKQLKDDVYVKADLGDTPTTDELAIVQKDERCVKSNYDRITADLSEVRLGSSIQGDVKSILKKKYKLKRRQIKLAMKILGNIETDSTLI